MRNKIHFVPTNWETLFIHGKANTNCNLNFNQVNDYTSIKEYVTCKKCKSLNDKIDSKF